MMKEIHINGHGRVFYTLLLTFAILALSISAVQASTECYDCDGVCDSYLTEENHDIPNMDSSLCPQPVANFCACPKAGCGSLLVNFTDWSIGCIDLWVWDFGDPASGSDNMSNEENPSHLYAQPGIYTVTLTISGAGGTASKTKKDYIVVRQFPTADFVSTTQSGCVPMTVKFEDRSIDPATWWWDFGDGTTSTDQNPSHTYTIPGTYTVTLKVLNECGKDIKTKEQYISVGKKPTANFETDAESICSGGIIHFTDLSLRASSWQWDFGDGATSTDNNPSHTYTTPGMYTVSLIVSNSCGSDTTIQSKLITVQSGPTADFDSDITESCSEGTVRFTDLSTGATAWLWHFGDGATSTEQNPTHRYDLPGTYSVRLRASNDCGDDERYIRNMIIIYDKPTAHFGVNTTTACTGDIVRFTDSSSSNVNNWQWDFGDGETSTYQNPIHTYYATGTYTVTLTVSGHCGDDTETQINLIHVTEAPFADFDVDQTEGCAPLTVHFTDKSVNATSLHWQFMPGHTSAEANPAFTFNDPGIYTVVLTATNDCGSRHKDTTIIVKGLPQVDFTANITESCNGDTISFTDHSIDADSLLWNFGDGATSTEQNPTHAYTSPGVYTVSLTAMNSCGDTVGYRRDYISVSHEPVSDFAADITTTCPGDVIHFSDNSQYAISWLWDFGDGETSTTQNPGHVYTVSGTYTVSLIAINNCGQDTLTKTDYVTVLPLPNADFAADNTEICAGATVSFTNHSTEAIDYYWNFGDGSTSHDTNPSHTYTTPGNYTVSLIASNDCGTDTVTFNSYISVSGDPVADFISPDVQTCEGASVSFFDNSYYATSWFWDFGDGTSSVEKNPHHSYNIAGLYTVTLKVSNPCGSDSVTKTDFITVFPKPTADFMSEDRDVCLGATVYFSDQSSNADSWLWSFGDGSTSPNRNPSHTYTTPGEYTITLTVSNECGRDSTTKTDYIHVHSGPSADFSASPVSGSAPLSVQFTDLSTSKMGITSWAWSFGDGNTSNDQSPVHTYASAGTYTVELIVSDECGRDTVSKEEYINVDDSCSIDFTAEPTEGCAPLTVYFSGISKGPCEIISWSWNFGDPASGTDNIAAGKDAQHIYQATGNYTVTLTVIDENGTKVVSKANMVTVYGLPVASFEMTPTAGTAPLVVNFTDRSTGDGINSWVWDFGDPTSGSDNNSTLQNPTHTYSTNGTHTVSLIVANECGADTVTADVSVSPEITITKEVDKGFAGIGDDLLYTVVIKNNGQSAVSEIFVVDTVPDSTMYIPGSADNGGIYDASEDKVTWTIPRMAANTEIRLSFKVTLNGPFTVFPTIVSNIATATLRAPAKLSDDPTTFVSNRVETIIDMMTGELGVRKTVSSSLASPGDVLTYTITVANNSPQRANNVVIYDAIPDSTSYVSGSISSGGTYTQATDSLRWDIGSLNAHESRSVSFQVTIDADVRESIEIPNTALVKSPFGGNQSNRVLTAVSTVPLVITKTANTPSGMIGDLMRFTITVENFSGEDFTDVQILDTMPNGILYVSGTSLLNDTTIADPSGDNPYTWHLGDLSANNAMTLTYTGLVSASASPGQQENVARAQAYQGIVLVQSNRAVARVYILGQTLSGSIRGRVIVDCDGDGIAETDSVPFGMDVYLDDGSHSQVNKSGMFYFSTVRPGERVVALDERDLNGYYIPDNAQKSVFVHVHETGESYVIFHICPEYPRLDIKKAASIVPTVKVTKKASMSTEPITDSLGVRIDYEIDIKSNGLANPTDVQIIDSFPEDTRVILDSSQALSPKQGNGQLVYDITASQERINKSVYYSLRDLTPGVRRFLNNKVHIKGKLESLEGYTDAVSSPANVAVGPFLLAPPQDVNITLTPALFITSKADLQPPATPQLEAAADSILKYADADVKVEGHTDYRRIHTKQFPSNWELGEARAKAVVDWLVANRNVDRDRLKYESFAATRPIVRTGTTSEELQPNRRTEIIIKARIGGFINPEVLSPEDWVSSTSLALQPITFDTLFETSRVPLETGLDDSWEVLLTVENTSAIVAEDITLSDVLPEGVAYIDNSATVDGNECNVTVTRNNLSIAVNRIDPSQKITIRYRVRALPGQTPTGGGSASIELTTSQNTPIIQKSNTVQFR